jgi:uncharacterized membrane protein YeaQ/YmgE (transglycosylase-associated protein family)
MLGMNFTSFLTLLVVSVVVAAVYHWILRYRFLAKVAVGWVGGWLGPPVLGHWLWKIQSVYLVPAILARSRSHSPQRAVLEGVCKDLRRWIGCCRGNPTEAGSIEQPGVLHKGVNKCNVNRLAAILRSPGMRQAS